MAYFLIPVYNYPLLLHISSFLYILYCCGIFPFLYIIIHCCGIFPHSCILLSTVVAYFLIPVYYYPLLWHISSFLYINYYPLLWHISSFLYIIIHCCGIFPHSCILLSTVVAYFLISVYYYPLLWHISSFLYIIIHCCGIFPHSCI